MGGLLPPSGGCIVYVGLLGWNEKGLNPRQSSGYGPHPVRWRIISADEGLSSNINAFFLGSIFSKC